MRPPKLHKLLEGDIVLISGDGKPWIAKVIDQDDDDQSADLVTCQFYRSHDAEGKRKRQQDLPAVWKRKYQPAWEDPADGKEVWTNRPWSRYAESATTVNQKHLLSGPFLLDGEGRVPRATWEKLAPLIEKALGRERAATGPM